MNKIDLLIYCDWLIDNSVNSDGLRIVVNRINHGIFGMNNLGVDISMGNNYDIIDKIGSGDIDGYGFGDGIGYGCGNGDGSGDGYGDSASYGTGFDLGGNWDQS